MVEISSMLVKAAYYQKERIGRESDQAKRSLLAQKRKFFLNPMKRNNAPTVSNTPPTGSNPIGVTDSTRNATTPVLEKIALREM